MDCNHPRLLVGVKPVGGPFIHQSTIINAVNLMLNAWIIRGDIGLILLHISDKARKEHAQRRICHDHLLTIGELLRPGIVQYGKLKSPSLVQFEFELKRVLIENNLIATDGNHYLRGRENECTTKTPGDICYWHELRSLPPLFKWTKGMVE